MIKNTAGFFEQFGIASEGDGRATPEDPGIYINVASESKRNVKRMDGSLVDTV